MSNFSNQQCEVIAIAMRDAHPGLPAFGGDTTKVDQWQRCIGNLADLFARDSGFKRDRFFRACQPRL
jgi:hypothetical protein